MDTLQIVLIALAIGILGFRIYQRIVKSKNRSQKEDTSEKVKKMKGQTDDDDYEPYKK